MRVIVEYALFQMIFNFKRWLEAEAYFRRRRALLTNYTQVDDYVCIWHQVPAQQTQWCFNVGPASQTMSRFCWVGDRPAG